MNVLESIFEEMRDSFSRRTLYWCMLVCRKWKVCMPSCDYIHDTDNHTNVQDAAEPALYADVVPKEHSLGLLAERVQMAALQGRPLATYIRKLYLSRVVPSESDPTAAVNNLVMVLQTNNLRRLWVHEPLTLPSMAIVSQICAASLQELGLVVRTQLPALKYVYFLTALRRLTITYSGTDPTFLNDTSPWAMPYLHFLSLSSECVPPLMDFMCRCDFPALQEFEFWEESIDSAASAQHVATFCSRLSLREIYLDIDDNHYAFLIPHIRATTLHLWSIHPTLTDYIPDAVKALRIPLRDTHLRGDTGSTLWTVFDSLLTGKTSVQDIYLGDDTNKPFCWIPNIGSEQLANMTVRDHGQWPKLLGYARILSQAGINLRDGQGKTVTEYFGFP
jgi:hypothetical protein